MGMTIDKTIDIMERYEMYGFNAQKDGRNKAIETMRKYQQIVNIVSLNNEEFKQCGLKELKEILEVIADGNEA